MEPWETLGKVQAELKAPKNLRNSFGGYNYRSAESILENLKPILKKYSATLVLSDNIEVHGDRIYVAATATFRTADGNAIHAFGLAREADEKKGMDPSQITGSASSYARKYALNGLFLLDDSKDADTDEYSAQSMGLNDIDMMMTQTEYTRDEAVRKTRIGKTKATALLKLIEATEKRAGATIDVGKLLDKLGVKTFADLTEEQHRDLVAKLENVKDGSKTQEQG